MHDAFHGFVGFEGVPAVLVGFCVADPADPFQCRLDALVCALR
jgi:hypothetical protein